MKIKYKVRKKKSLVGEQNDKFELEEFVHSQATLEQRQGDGRRRHHSPSDFFFFWRTSVRG